MRVRIDCYTKNYLSCYNKVVRAYIAERKGNLWKRRNIHSHTKKWMCKYHIVFTHFERGRDRWKDLRFIRNEGLLWRVVLIFSNVIIHNLSIYYIEFFCSPYYYFSKVHDKWVKITGKIRSLLKIWKKNTLIWMYSMHCRRDLHFCFRNFKIFISHSVAARIAAFFWICCWITGISMLQTVWLAYSIRILRHSIPWQRTILPALLSGWKMNPA